MKAFCARQVAARAAITAKVFIVCKTEVVYFGSGSSEDVGTYGRVFIAAQEVDAGRSFQDAPVLHNDAK